MASNKETPRQRMIGMMYLVLTALLALQVSSAMIYKFQSLNESLEHTAKETSGWNNQKLRDISLEVKDRGSRPDEVTLVTDAEKISAESKSMMQYIEDLKQDLIKQTGGYDDDGNLKGAKEETRVEVIMIGANKNGQGYQLRKKLDDFVAFMNNNSSTQFSPLALDGKDDPLFSNKEDQKNKDFVELNFGQTPLIAGLAILSEIQSRIATMEATTLNQLSKKIAYKDFKVDVMAPMARPVSKVVAAGTKYEAELFMAATSSSSKPLMQVGTAPLEVDHNGVGKISFTASGGNFGPDGTMKKTWTGKVTVKKPEGGDTTYTITEEYIVAKPVIQVQTASMPALYRNCGNKLNVQVPALGNAYNPRFTAEGAQVFPEVNRGIVTVVPTGASVKLKVTSDGNFIGEEPFAVRLIPPPTLEIKVNNRKPAPLGVPVAAARTLTVKAIPEEEFASLLPNDSRYEVVEWKLTHARGRRAVSRPKIYTTEGINLTEIIREAQERDNLIIEILKVKRKNFRGQWEEVQVPNPVQIIPLI